MPLFPRGSFFLPPGGIPCFRFLYGWPLQKEPCLVDQRSRCKTQEGQSAELSQSEPPGARFPLGDGDGADAGQGNQAEYHDADALERGVAGFKAGVQCLLDRKSVV